MRFLWILALPLLLSCTSSEQAEAPETSNKPAEATAPPDLDDSWSDWKPQLEEMSSYLQLTDDEKARLADAFAEQATKISTWYEGAGKKLKEYEQIARDAIKNRDLSQTRKLREAVPLRQAFEQLKAARVESVLNALPEEKRLQWDAHLLFERLIKLAKSIDISDEQKAKIEKLSVEAAEKVQNKENPPAAGFLELEKLVVSEVFDTAQKAAYEALQEKNPLRSLFKK